MDGFELTRRNALAGIAGTAPVMSGCLARFGRSAHHAEGVERTEVFVSGRDGYKRYRIPALLTTDRGTLLAFCEGRRDGPDRGATDLLVRRSTDNGRSWSDTTVVYAEGDATISNPTPVQDRHTGTIHLPVCREYRDVLMLESTDDGRTWTDPEEITDAVKRDEWGYYGTGPGVGLQLQRGATAGRLVIPATHWTSLWEDPLPEDTVRYDHVFYSDDRGESWHLGGTVAPHVDEPQTVELPDGRLLINMRNVRAGTPNPAGVRAVARSCDGGRTWSDVEFDETLVTPACQASLIRYSWPEDGRSRLLFSNPAHPDKRVNMTVRLSYDEGNSWEYSKRLYGSKSAYSCLAVLPDGSVGCLFENGDAIGSIYRRVSFYRFTIEWLTDGTDTPAL